jgi:HEAT repeat protein
MLLEAEPIAGAVGGALLTGAFTRQLLGRRSAARRLRRALRDPDPAERAAAAEAAGESGVTRNAALLLAAADLEKDVWVRQVIAQTVQRHLWEPPTSRAMIDLRIWAKRELNWARFDPIEPVAEQGQERRIAVESSTASDETVTLPVVRGWES